MDKDGDVDTRALTFHWRFVLLSTASRTQNQNIRKIEQSTTEQTRVPDARAERGVESRDMAAAAAVCARAVAGRDLSPHRSIEIQWQSTTTAIIIASLTYERGVASRESAHATVASKNARRRNLISFDLLRVKSSTQETLTSLKPTMLQLD